MRRLALVSLLTFAFITFTGAGYYVYAARNAPRAGAPALLSKSEQANKIVIEKAARRMTLLRDGAVISVHDIKLGFSPGGQKVREGDGKTPEGLYHINRRNSRSKFHLSLGLTYPTAEQRKAAKAEGRNPGGDIFIHGQPNALGELMTLPHDWTDGCIAVSNEEIRTIWARIDRGVPVLIKP